MSARRLWWDVSHWLYGMHASSTLFTFDAAEVERQNKPFSFDICYQPDALHFVIREWRSNFLIKLVHTLTSINIAEQSTVPGVQWDVALSACVALRRDSPPICSSYISQIKTACGTALQYKTLVASVEGR
jgi:hypothetical protein